MQDVNVVIWFCLELRANVSLGVPKIAVSGHGCKLKFCTEDIKTNHNRYVVQHTGKTYDLQAVL